MCHRVTAIKKYFVNLDYIQIDKADAISKISALTEQISKKEVNTLLERLYDIESVIKENWSLFASFCKHIDIMSTIMNYLTFFGRSIAAEDKINTIAEIAYFVFYNVCPETEVRSFLNAALSFFIEDWRFFTLFNGQINEMILLEDSDLYAVVSCLKIIEKETVIKIWIQERIKEKLLWYKMKYFHDLNFSIHTFRSKRELFTSNIYNETSMVSIWSEDIVTAKNLAKFLNKLIIFINTHMDFYDSNIIIPNKIIELSQLFTASAILNSGDYISKSSKDKINVTQATKMLSIPKYNLFYDGKWQRSANTTYCKSDNGLWANVTNDDIRKCVNSAQKGVEIWSNKPIHLRKELLYNVINALDCTKYRCLQYNLKFFFSHTLYRFNTFHTYVTRKGYEITKEYVPLGIVILKEEREDVLFTRLFKLLLAGNSVIVIHNANFYNFCPYCDIFATCGMPPGVINVLSNDDIKNLELYLCKTDYSTYTNIIYKFPGYPMQVKEIILPLK